MRNHSIHVQGLKTNQIPDYVQFHILKSTNIFENEIRQNHCEIFEKIQINYELTTENRQKKSNQIKKKKKKNGELSDGNHLFDEKNW